jgi:hypothetical protein
MTVQVDAQGRAVARASITDNVEPNIQILIAPEGQHETQDLSRLDVREIKDGHQPAFRADNYFLSKARTDNPILPTLVREPTYPSPITVYTTAQ